LQCGCCWSLFSFLIDPTTAIRFLGTWQQQQISNEYINYFSATFCLFVSSWCNNYKVISILIWVIMPKRTNPSCCKKTSSNLLLSCSLAVSSIFVNIFTEGPLDESISEFISMLDSFPTLSLVSWYWSLANFSGLCQRCGRMRLRIPCDAYTFLTLGIVVLSTCLNNIGLDGNSLSAASAGALYGGGDCSHVCPRDCLLDKEPVYRKGKGCELKYWALSWHETWNFAWWDLSWVLSWCF
jgi:hypothetical protein